MISIKDINKQEAKYDPKFLARMAAIGIDCPPLGTELSFRVTGKGKVHTIANALRVGLNDGINVLCLDVNVNTDVSKSNITTNSPYFISQIFCPYVLNMIPIRQIGNAKFSINVNNDTDTYRAITSADIRPLTEMKEDAFDQNHHIAVLPPRTFLSIENITPSRGVGYKDGIGHSYAVRIGYEENIPEQDYSISTSPTTVADPVQMIMQVCRMYTDMLSNFRRAVSDTDDYNYADDVFKVSRVHEKLVVYRCEDHRASFGAMIEEFGQMIDPSPETHITYNVIHNTVVAVEIKVRHANVKKYMIHILDTLIKIWKDIMASFVI
jgi:hypothetical protein